MIRFVGLSVGWNPDAPVLADLDLAVPAGRILTVLGPSGCGKTTLLKAAAGLWTPHTPGLWWKGAVEGRDPGATAMIFQDLGLLPWKTVEENVALPLTWKEGRGHTPEVRARVGAALAEFGLEGHAHSWPAQLSGGLAQRVAIARALVLRPSLLLMDEPFSALDALTRERAQLTLWNLWRDHGPTIVLVTHSVDEAVALGHRCAVMTGSPGRLAALVDFDDQDSPDERRRRPRFHEHTVALRAALAGEAR